MDKINFILERLHVDSSIFFQLAIYIFLFYFLKFTIFGKLKEIVILRESSTISLDQSANIRLQDVVNLENDYNLETRKIHKQAQDYFSEQRSNHLSETQKIMKTISEKYDNEFEVEKEKILNKKSEISKILIKESKSLSSDLLQRLT